MFVLTLALAALTADTIPRPETRNLRISVAAAETLTVDVTGAGTPVVLVPGLFGSAWGYRHVVALLAESGYRAIVIEPLAMGTSTRPAHSDYSFTAQAARLAAVLDTLGITGAVVVGHSAGAAIVYRLALLRPDLVGAIVSLDGGPAESPATPGFRRAMSLAPLLRLAGAGFLRGRIRSSLLAASGDTAWVTDEAIARYTAGATADLGATLRAFTRMAESREPQALAPRLSQLQCPVLILLGGAPHESAPRAAQLTLLRSVPGFASEVLAGAGHYLHEERPDAVVTAIRRVASQSL